MQYHFNCSFCSPLLACLPVNKRGELNDERNTSKIETVDELRVLKVWYNADPEQKSASARDSFKASLVPLYAAVGGFLSPIRKFA